MITLSNQIYSKYYYGRRATLSIDNVLLLRRIPKGAVVCNIEHPVGDRGTSAGASKDYAIVISRNPDNDVWTGDASRRRKATMADGCL